MKKYSSVLTMVVLVGLGACSGKQNGATKSSSANRSSTPVTDGSPSQGGSSLTDGPIDRKNLDESLNDADQIVVTMSDYRVGSSVDGSHYTVDRQYQVPFNISTTIGFKLTKVTRGAPAKISTFKPGSRGDFNMEIPNPIQNGEHVLESVLDNGNGSSRDVSKPAAMTAIEVKNFSLKEIKAFMDQNLSQYDHIDGIEKVQLYFSLWYDGFGVGSNNRTIEGAFATTTLADLKANPTGVILKINASSVSTHEDQYLDPGAGATIKVQLVRH